MATAVRKHHHVRISDESHRALQELTVASGLSMTAIIDRAIEHYRREQIFAQVADAWAAMEDEFMDEHAALEGTIADGLAREAW